MTDETAPASSPEPPASHDDPAPLPVLPIVPVVNYDAPRAVQRRTSDVVLGSINTRVVVDFV